MGLQTGSGGGGVKKYVDLASVSTWPTSAVPALPGPTVNTHYTTYAYNTAGAANNVPVPTAAVGDTIVIAIGGTGSPNVYTTNIQNWVGWTFVLYTGSTYVTRTIPAGVTGSYNIWGGSATPDASTAALGTAIVGSNYTAAYGPFYAYKAMTVAQTGPSAIATGNLVTSTGTQYAVAVNVGVAGAPVSQLLSPAIQFNIGNQLITTSASNATTYTYGLSPNVGVPYLHMLGTNNSSAVQALSVNGATPTNTQPYRLYSSGGVQLTFRQVYGLDFNTANVIPSDGGSGYNHYSTTAFFHAAHPGALPETFTIPGEILLDRLELINASLTERRAYLLVSGPNISYGVIGTQQSEVFGATYLNNEGVTIYQTDNTSANSFRVLGIGRPVK